LGGLRAVAWTDCIQGLMLLVGLLGLLLAVVPTVEHWRGLMDWLNEHQPQKIAVPSAGLCRTWLSTVLLIGFSGSVYPHAIQRIYAAKNVRALKQSLQIMVFMPLVTMTIVVIVGLVGIRRFGGLQGVAADQIMPLLLREWSQQSIWMYAMAVLVLTGTLAAIMSTADSVLLTLSSILSKDFLGKSVLRGSPEERLTQMGKGLSWVIMGILAIIAFAPRITLWGLTELKSEILLQVSPVFVLGLIWPRLKARAALMGILAGALLAITLALAGVGRIWGFHAGLLAWALNVALCVGLSWFPARGRMPGADGAVA
jgi:SSS family solute:Na+ symporter/sodium/pantothenate symporter